MTYVEEMQGRPRDRANLFATYATTHPPPMCTQSQVGTLTAIYTTRLTLRQMHVGLGTRYSSIHWKSHRKNRNELQSCDQKQPFFHDLLPTARGSQTSSCILHHNNRGQYGPCPGERGRGWAHTDRRLQAGKYLQTACSASAFCPEESKKGGKIFHQILSYFDVSLFHLQSPMRCGKFRSHRL